MLPQMPAEAPHSRSPPAGATAGSSGTSSARMMKPENCDSRTTATVSARFEVKPPMKSAAP